MSISRQQLYQLAGTENWNTQAKQRGTDPWSDVYETQSGHVTIEITNQSSPPTITILGPEVTITQSLTHYYTIRDVALKYGFSINVWDTENKWRQMNASFSDTDAIKTLFETVHEITLQPCYKFSTASISRADVKQYVTLFNELPIEYPELYANYPSDS